MTPQEKKMLLSYSKLFEGQLLSGIYIKGEFRGITSKGYVSRIPLDNGQISLSTLGVETTTILTPLAQVLMEKGYGIETGFSGKARIYKYED